MNRRHFLVTSAAASGALLRSSANETVRLGCVGIRGMGRGHVERFAKMPNVEVAALCDVDESVLAARLTDLEKAGWKRPAVFSDVRRLLEDKSIDAISIATPNHWHTLITILACQAGKDVYVEKPCSHNIFESRQIVAATRKYDRIVQHGTQSRSSVALQDAIQKMREGIIGEVYMARGLCFKTRDTIGHAPDEPVPAGVDYDLWLGPAPKRPFSRNRFHYNWHWNWDYGNGEIGNQGIHQMDVARWGLGVRYPVKISGMGARFMFDDDQQTPNSMVSTFEFDEAGKKKQLVFEVRHWLTNREEGVTVGNLFYGSQGYFTTTGNKFFLGKNQSPRLALDDKSGDNLENFIKVVRSRKRSEQNAEIEEGAISCVLVHLANISYRLGRTLNFDPNTLRCIGDEEANSLFTRDYRSPFIVPVQV
jgi:predicted dehydrogenase